MVKRIVVTTFVVVASISFVTIPTDFLGVASNIVLIAVGLFIVVVEWTRWSR